MEVLTEASERNNVETYRSFPLGVLHATASVADEVTLDEQTSMFQMHASRLWGNVSTEDAKANDLALIYGERILSSYVTSAGKEIWCITEADRSSTTLLYPEEY